MRVCSFGVPKDGVGQPDHPHHVAVECQFLHGAVISEAAVCPCLGEDDVNLVLLRVGESFGQTLSSAAGSCWLQQQVLHNRFIIGGMMGALR